MRRDIWLALAVALLGAAPACCLHAKYHHEREVMRLLVIERQADAIREALSRPGVEVRIEGEVLTIVIPAVVDTSLGRWPCR